MVGALANAINVMALLLRSDEAASGTCRVSEVNVQAAYPLVGLKSEGAGLEGTVAAKHFGHLGK
jgi:hypothetical protein